MTLDEAIKHTEEVAEEKENEAWEAQLQEEYKTIKSCKECAKEHRQLAEWLKELKHLREQTRWIPVSKRLPKSSGEYLVSVVDGSGEANDYEAVEVAWFAHKKDYNIEESEWRELGIDEVVIAWKPHPQPYKVKSEDVE